MRLSQKTGISILIFIFLTASFFNAFSQSEPVSTKAPRLGKTDIGQSGCSAYLPPGMPEFDLSKSEDNSDVYTSEVELDSFVFGCIAVRFSEPFTDASPDEMEELLISYMDFLKSPFEITSAVGYGKGHLLDGYPDARGVIDYWEDGNGRQYAVKGWVNQKYIGFLYIGGAGDYPYLNLQQMYLDGFRFGE